MGAEWGSRLRDPAHDVPAALDLYHALREEDGVYVSEWEDGTNLANRNLTPLRGRRLA